jgi:hypothetical protein
MASSSRARAAVIASGILIATPAGAQSSDTPPPPPAAQEKPPAPATPPPAQARPMNMQPGAMQAPPPKRGSKRQAAPPRRGKGKGHAVHTPGAPIAGGAAFYRLDDGSTRVSVEVSEKVPVAENRAQGRLIYRLKGVFIPERTNTLPLVTGYFATPVDRAQLVQDGADVELVIDLRDATAPTHRVVETSRGMVLQVDFPKVAAERAFEVPQDNAGRDRAKRRTETQSLGTDHKED